MPSHARVNQGDIRVTVQRSIHTKPLHGIVQGLCILAGIKALEVLHRPPVDLEERRQEGEKEQPLVGYGEVEVEAEQDWSKVCSHSGLPEGKA